MTRFVDEPSQFFSGMPHYANITNSWMGKAFDGAAGALSIILLATPPPGKAQTVYRHGDPLAEEQVMLEMINRARANPAAEVARLGLRSINQGIEAGSISLKPKPPLAFNRHLIVSAEAHSVWMLRSSAFSHEGANGSNPWDRMESAGYTPYKSTAENIAIHQSTGSISIGGEAQGLQNDLVRSTDGHRETIFSESVEEIGIGLRQGKFLENGTNWNAVVVTQNFGKRFPTTGADKTGPYLTGVCYKDLNVNGLYDAGEGIAGVKVQPAGGEYYGLTSTSGGYTVPYAGSGSIQVSFTGNMFIGQRNKFVIPTGDNVKLDFLVPGPAEVPPALLVLSGMKLFQTGKIEITVAGGVSGHLILEETTDLTSGPWREVMTAAHRGGTSTTTLSITPSSGQTRTFYRAKQ